MPLQVVFWAFSLTDRQIAIIDIAVVGDYATLEGEQIDSCLSQWH